MDFSDVQFRAFLTVHARNMFTRAASENNWGVLCLLLVCMGVFSSARAGLLRPSFPQVQAQEYCAKAEW